jgi:hypothetical protein
MTTLHASLLTDLVVPLAAADAVICVNPANTRTFIQAICLHNSGDTLQVGAIYLVKHNGAAEGAAAKANRVFYFSLGPNATIDRKIPGLGWVLMSEHDSLRGFSTTANEVNVTLSGEVATT